LFGLLEYTRNGYRSLCSWTIRC